jgi:hypothetical protein
VKNSDIEIPNNPCCLFIASGQDRCWDDRA